MNKYQRKVNKITNFILGLVDGLSYRRVRAEVRHTDKYGCPIGCDGCEEMERCIVNQEKMKCVRGLD